MLDFCKRKGRGTKTERSKIWLFSSELTAESDEKRAAKFKQQETFIPQWPKLAIID